jgi:hypothetical protein
MAAIVDSSDTLTYPPAPRAAQRIEQLEHEQRRLTEEVAELRRLIQTLLGPSDDDLTRYWKAC